MNKSTAERKPVEELDDIFTFDDPEPRDGHMWNKHIVELKNKMEKLKDKKDGTSKQTFIQETGGKAIITAQYWDKKLTITLAGGFSQYEFGEIYDMVKALNELKPSIILGWVYKGKLPKQFLLAVDGIADHQAQEDWFLHPHPVKTIDLLF